MVAAAALAATAALAPAATGGGRAGGGPGRRRRGGAWSGWGFCASNRAEWRAAAEVEAEWGWFVREVCHGVSSVLTTCFGWVGGWVGEPCCVRSWVAVRILFDRCCCPICLCCGRAFWVGTRDRSFRCRAFAPLAALISPPATRFEAGRSTRLERFASLARLAFFFFLFFSREQEKAKEQREYWKPRPLSPVSSGTPSSTPMPNS